MKCNPLTCVIIFLPKIYYYHYLFFTLIFIFFLVFDFFFGNSHFIYAQISIREIKPIEKKIFNIEQSLGKAEDKDSFNGL